MIMESKFLIFILLSFVLTFALSPIFISLLFRFNIRRISKSDLDDKLPERTLKFGTPVMGGALITFSALALSFLFLRSWTMFIPFSLILIIGSIFGAFDEFINTIGRKGFSFAVRESIDAVVIKSALAWKIYKVLLIPWDSFKEIFRVMGSTQRGLKTHTKFLMQLGIALIGTLWLYVDLGYQTIWLPLFGEVYVGLLYVPIVLFLALGFANAFGVTDGMDGLSAGLHSITFLAYGVLAIVLGYPLLAYFCAFIVGGELAFLYFNIHPARVEMSDVGTLPLGMLFVFIASVMKREATLPIIGAVFAIEILSSFTQQWSAKLRHGKRVFLLAPIHHHFEKMGWHETKVTMRFWLACAIFSIIGLVVGLL